VKYQQNHNQTILPFTVDAPSLNAF